MSSLNKCIFIGRMTADPDKRSTSSGDVVNFTIACSEKYKDKSGNAKETTEFIRCYAWGQVANIISDYTFKGSLVYVEGKWKTRSYDKDNTKHYITECQVFSFQMLDSKKDDKPSQNYNRGDGAPF